MECRVEGLYRVKVEGLEFVSDLFSFQGFFRVQGLWSEASNRKAGPFKLRRPVYCRGPRACPSTLNCKPNTKGFRVRQGLGQLGCSFVYC